jgi:hypothetical protein
MGKNMKKLKDMRNTEYRVKEKNYICEEGVRNDGFWTKIFTPHIIFYF